MAYFEFVWVSLGSHSVRLSLFLILTFTNPLMYLNKNVVHLFEFYSYDLSFLLFRFLKRFVCVCYILPRALESPLDIWVLHQHPNLTVGYRLVIYTKDCTLKGLVGIVRRGDLVSYIFFFWRLLLGSSILLGLYMGWLFMRVTFQS